jgi:Na+-translocating ferredoxin:NAD+ oxidoreductase RnfG subunit
MKKVAYTFEFFHGTSSKFLQRIMKEGLSSSPRERVFDEASRKPGEVGHESYPGAYVSNSFELAYRAGQVARDKFGGNILIVVGKVETRTPEARLDEDHVHEPGMGFVIQDRMIKNWLTHINVLEHLAFDISDDKIRDASRAWVEKVLEIYPTEEVMNKSVVALRTWLDMRIALALEREEKDSVPWKSIMEKLKKRFNSSIPSKYTEPNTAMRSYRAAMDEFLAKAKDLLKQEKRKYELTNVRLTKPIAYKGANKVEAIVEIDETQDPVQITIYYASNRGAIGLMLAEYQNIVGANFEVK